MFSFWEPYFPPSCFIFTFIFSCSLVALPILFYQTIFCNSLCITDLGLWMILSFIFTLKYSLLWWNSAIAYYFLEPLMHVGTFQFWKLKRHCYIYLIFGNKKKNFLNVAKKRKRIVNVLKRESSFRIKNHFSEIIKMVSFFFYLNMICAPSRFVCDPRETSFKSQPETSKIIFIKPNATRNWPKNLSKWTWNQLNMS